MIHGQTTRRCSMPDEVTIGPRIENYGVRITASVPNVEIEVFQITGDGAVKELKDALAASPAVTEFRAQHSS
jgi:hypothetical protein